MKVTFIRHTHVAVKSGICYGQSDVPVAHTFEEEANHVKESLRHRSFDQIYSSPLSRCKQLAHHCGFLHPIFDDRLKELHFGQWEMQHWNSITDPHLELWYSDWIHLPTRGGESFIQQYQRVAHFLNELQQTHQKEVAIFTHRGVIACASVYAGLCSLENSFQQEIDYGSITDLIL
jgi:alpha-ribazole phosphatase